MLRFVRFFVCVVLPLAGLGAALAAPVWCEQRELKTDAAEQIDAILLLDASGSMLLNDPHRLREEGARLFVEFLKQEDRVGVVEFAEDAKVIRGLAPFDSANREEIERQIKNVSSSGEYTDLLAGVRLAGDLLEQNSRDEAKQIIVLLSDGKMDPNPQKGTAQAFTEKLLVEILPALKAKGIRLYSLCFSEEADKKLLEEASVGTDGAMWFTPSADKVHESYAELFLAVKKPQVIPLGAKGFDVDGDIQEATFYINRGEGADIRMVTPGGKQLGPDTREDKVKWFKAQKFDVITITAPEVGTWQVLGVSPSDGFATILTNLKLVTDWPTSVESHKPLLLQARLYESKKPVALPEMSEVIQYAFQIMPTDRIAEPVARDLLVDDGTKGDKIARDGIFSYLVEIAQPGEYRLRVLAKAPTFERQQQIPFRVKPPLINLQVLTEDEASAPAAEEDHAAEEHPTAAESRTARAKQAAGLITGSEKAVFKVSLSEEASTFKNIQLKLSAKDEKRSLFYLPLTRSLADPLEYEGKAEHLPHDGRYALQVSLTAEARGRKSVKETSPVLEFKRLTTGVKEVEVEVVAVEHEKPASQGWFPWLGVVVITLANAAAGILALMLLKRSQGQILLSVPTFETSEQILSAVGALEQKAAVQEVNLDDPLFSEGAGTAEGGDESRAE